MRFRDILQLTRSGRYSIHVPWSFLLEQIKHYEEAYGFIIDSPFQRAHIWTKEKRVRYVEFCLKGGKSSQEILLNCKDWNVGGSGKYPIVVVDGKQRLTAVLMFLRDELPIFDGNLFSSFEDKLHASDSSFIFTINDLKTDREILQWYIDINSGGVAHTDEEINKVKKMLEDLP
jgi:uncharacterized protein with ParB-like and HNH nuclease domain